MVKNLDPNPKKCIICGNLFWQKPTQGKPSWSKREVCSKECNNANNVKKRKESLDITGQKFHRLTAVREVGRRRDRHMWWLFRCECGKEIIVPRSRVMNGYVKSCGCLQRELASKVGKVVNTRHGMSKTRFHNIYCGILSRCHNPNRKKYKDYGGRGILCLWETFEEFRDDKYEDYLKHVNEFGEIDTEIDRINVDGHYCKENCKWSTRLEQARNKRYKKQASLIYVVK